MFFKTTAECADFARLLGLNPSPSENVLHKSDVTAETIQIDFSDKMRATFPLARQIVSWLGPYGYCLLWVTEFGLCAPLDNWHLYYRLRSSYQDHRELPAAPGHVFFSHESSDLATFVDLVLRFGWGAFLFGAHCDCRVTISHDEWIRVESELSLDAVVQAVEKFSLPYKTISARRTLNA